MSNQTWIGSVFGGTAQGHEHRNGLPGFAEPLARPAVHDGAAILRPDVSGTNISDQADPEVTTDSLWAKKASPRAVSSSVTGPGLAEASLDAVGHLDELLRVRVNNVGARLRDLRHVQDDFDRLVGSLLPITSELPALRIKAEQARELAALESESKTELLRQIAAFTSQNAALSVELQTAQAAAQRQEGAVDSSRTELDALRKLVKQRETFIQEIEWQLTTTDEQVRRLAEANRLLTAAGDSADQKLAQREAELAATVHRLASLEQEHARLNARSAEHLVRYNDLTKEHGDQEGEVGTLRRQLSQAVEQVASEAELRQRAEAELASERLARRNVAAELETRVDELTARGDMAEKALLTARVELGEKNEALIFAQRAVQTAHIEKQTLEQGEAALRQALVERQTHAGELERAIIEKSEHCETLQAALSGVTGELEQTKSRAASLQGAVEHLSGRLEHQRFELEGANRSLFAQLQAERAQRTLAQGGLAASRESLAEVEAELRRVRCPQEAFETADETAASEPTVLRPTEY